MKKLFILLLSTSVLISCSDDFTDIDPVGSLNDASLQNATGVDLLLTGAIQYWMATVMRVEVTGLEQETTGGWMF